MSCKRGDVVLVGFVFTDRTAAKKRPALVVSTGRFAARRQELVIAAITSNLRVTLYGDHVIEKWKDAGLVKPSKLTPIIATIREVMVLRRLGKLSTEDMNAYSLKLAEALGLG